MNYNMFKRKRKTKLSVTDIEGSTFGGYVYEWLILRNDLDIDLDNYYIRLRRC